MVIVSMNEFKGGFKIMFDNEFCVIFENEYVKLGKGQVFNCVRICKLFIGKVLEKIFKLGDIVEVVDVVDIDLDYLYNDGEFYYFMNNSIFEQFVVDVKVVGENVKWLVENNICMLMLWNGNLIVVILLNFVELEVIEMDLGVKGDI